MALLGVGVAAYPVTQHLHGLRLTRFGRVCLTCVEPLLYISVIYYMCTEKASLKDYYYTLLLALALIISFSGQTYLERPFNNGLMGFLGRFSVPLYFWHFVWSSAVGKLGKELPLDRRMVVYLGVSFASATFIYLPSALIRRWQIAAKWKRLFVAGA